MRFLSNFVISLNASFLRSGTASAYFTVLGISMFDKSEISAKKHGGQSMDFAVEMVNF